METSDIGMADKSESPLDEAQRRGVYNSTLFCLGMALLQIAYWKPLDLLAEDYDEDTIDTVRRLANGKTIFGAWYDELVSKCLRCDFAMGTDLRDAKLQKAVFNDITVPIEEIVTKLKSLNLRNWPVV
jgi:hypothetical protein